MFITLVPFVASCILATGIYTVKLATQQKLSKGRHNWIFLKPPQQRASSSKNSGSNAVWLPMNLCPMRIWKNVSRSTSLHQDLSLLPGKPLEWNLLKLIIKICFSAGPYPTLGMAVWKTDKSPSSLEEQVSDRSIWSTTFTQVHSTFIKWHSTKKTKSLHFWNQLLKYYSSVKFCDILLSFSCIWETYYKRKKTCIWY